MNLTVFYRPATPGERATQIDQLISERNAMLAALRKAEKGLDEAFDGHAHGPVWDALCAVRAAIAKAEAKA